jgi:hypothetical protein
MNKQYAKYKSAKKVRPHTAERNNNKKDLRHVNNFMSKHTLNDRIGTSPIIKTAAPALELRAANESVEVTEKDRANLPKIDIDSTAQVINAPVLVELPETHIFHLSEERLANIQSSDRYDEQCEVISDVLEQVRK